MQQENTLYHRIPDPIHGTIDAPDWLVRIENVPGVRRMMFIRELGLSIILIFPGAIHTRYAHVLGVMHLTGKIVDIFAREQEDLEQAIVLQFGAQVKPCFEGYISSTWV